MKPRIPPFVRPDPRTDVRPATARADYEGAWTRVIAPSNGSTTVFRTSRRWRGIDVFIAKPTFDSPGAETLARIKIFAVIEGMDRVLVATGIYRHPVVAANIPPSRWVCGARVACDRFEVELSYNAVPLNPGVDMLDVGVIASDELVSLETIAGAPFSSGPELLTFDVRRAPALAAGDPGYEIVSVHATRAAAAAPRWLHIHDSNDPTGAAILAQNPVFSFGLPAVGDTVFDASELLRTYRFKSGIVAAISTNGANTVLGAAGDLAWQVFFR